MQFDALKKTVLFIFIWFTRNYIEFQHAFWIQTSPTVK